MQITTPSPVIGYDRASKGARQADDEIITLCVPALSEGVVAGEFDRVRDPATTVRCRPASA